MNHTLTTLMTEPANATSHRYQIYRQARNGLHYSHGPIIDSPTDAVALSCKPRRCSKAVRCDFGITMSNAASHRRIGTRIGFTVRLRSNEFQDPTLATIAERIAERETLAQTLSTDIRLTT